MVEKSGEKALTLRESIEQLRAIPATWKYLDDPLAKLQKIRENPNYAPDYTVAEERRRQDETSEHPLGHFAVASSVDSV